jgi:iron-sulfur cluster repair protein YtfE (RIC family)
LIVARATGIHDGGAHEGPARRLLLQSQLKAIMSETIFEALRESHKIQRSLIRKLTLSKIGERRIELFTSLRIELAAHEAAEERYLYAPILMDDRGLHSARDALSDHHKMDDMVEDLQVRNHSGSGWMATVAKLSEELHDHLREEEKIFFQLAGKILSATQKTRLAVKYRKDYQRVQETLRAE